MREETGEYPVIMLDDVMSELDHHRRSFLLAILDTRAQTIITTTHLEVLMMLPKVCFCISN